MGELQKNTDQSLFKKTLNGFKESTYFITFVPVMVIFVLSSFFIYEADNVSVENNAIRSISKTLSLNSQGLNLILDIETGFRGYLLTGNSVFLQPFSEAMPLVDETLDELKKSVSSDPKEKAYTEAIQAEYDEWIKYADRLILLRKNRGAYRNFKLNLDGKIRMDSIRRLFTNIRDDQMAQLQKERVRASRRGNELRVWGTLFSCILAMSLAIFFRRKLLGYLQKTLAVSQQLKIITDTAPVSIVYIDKNERYAFVNRYYLEHYNSNNPTGKTIREVFGPEVYAKFSPYIRKVLEGNAVSFESELTRPDKSLIYLSVMYSPSFDEKGNVSGFVSISENITERKNANFELQRSQESLAFALQSAKMGTWEMNLETNFISCSQETLNLFGYTADEWDGSVQVMRARVHPHDWEKLELSVKAAINNDTVYELEYRVIPKLGQEKWVIARGRCFYEPSTNRPLRFMGMAYEITERKEKELKNAFLLKAVSAFSKILTPQELLATAIRLCSETFGSESGMLALLNKEKTHLCFVPNKKFISTNQENSIPINSTFLEAQIFRSGKPTFLGSRAERHALYPEEKEEDAGGATEEAFAGMPLIFEGQYVGLLGILFKKTRIFSEADKQAFIAVGDLISQSLERSKLYEQTVLERDQYRAFFDLSGSGAVEVDAKTQRFVRANKQMCNITGYSEEELKNMTFHDIAHPEDRELGVTIFKKAGLGEDGAIRVEKRYLKKDGSVCWVIINATLLRDANGLPLRSLATIFDITDLKEAEVALKTSIEARDNFLSIASHELKTPLTSLLLQTQFRQLQLRRNKAEVFSPDKIEEYLKSQYEYVQRIARLVDDILDVSRISEKRLTMQFERFDLREMVLDVLNRFKIDAETANVDIHLEASEPVFGEWDRFRLEQVLLNILTNALRYGNKKPIHIQVHSDDRNALLSIRDEGIGIKPEDTERIFQRFERAISENEVSGLGLGLYISKEIVSRHDGTISVKSEPGKGTEFIVSLPCISGAKQI